MFRHPYCTATCRDTFGSGGLDHRHFHSPHPPTHIGSFGYEIKWDVHPAIQQLETARLRLRRPRLGAADAMFASASDVEVIRYLAFLPATDVSFVTAFRERCDKARLDE